MSNTVAGYRLVQIVQKRADVELWKATNPSGADCAVSIRHLDGVPDECDFRTYTVIQSLSHPGLTRLRHWFLVDSEGAVIAGEEVQSTCPPGSRLLFETPTFPGTLQDFLLKKPKRSDIYRALFQIADVLDFLNAANHQLFSESVGIQHGSVRQESVRLGLDGWKISEYAFARAMHSAAIPIGVKPGPPSPYTPPESRNYRVVTQWSDQYSFAVLAVASLTGSDPVMDDQGALSLVGITGQASEVLGRALHDDPDARYGNIREFLVHLEQARFPDLGKAGGLGQTMVGFEPKESSAEETGGDNAAVNWDQRASKLDTAVYEFKLAWQSSEMPPQIGDLLPPVVHEEADEAKMYRRQLLYELIQVDLGYRWRRISRNPELSSSLHVDPNKEPIPGTGPRLEDYVVQFPDVRIEGDFPVALIAEEYRVRQLWGDQPGHQEYFDRFPKVADELAKELGNVDQSLIIEQESKPEKTVKVDRKKKDKVEGKSFGRYRLTGFLGKGNMGEVHRAYDENLHREIALKLPRIDKSADQTVVDRFLREARAMAKIRHPNVCPIYDAGEIDGQYYLTLALVEGGSLEDLAEEGRMPPEESAVIVQKLAQALEVVHRADVVHRDIKPSNVMMDGREPLLMDFGLARGIQVDTHLTATGAIVGTPAYMSPEQVKGNPDKIDNRTDIYSLGTVFYELLTGRIPFNGSLAEVLGQITFSDPPAPRSINSEVAPELEAICLKAMAKAAEDRYQTAEEFAEAIAEHLRPQVSIGRRLFVGSIIGGGVFAAGYAAVRYIFPDPTAFSVVVPGALNLQAGTQRSMAIHVKRADKSHPVKLVLSGLPKSIRAVRAGTSILDNESNPGNFVIPSSIEDMDVTFEADLKAEPGNYEIGIVASCGEDRDDRKTILVVTEAKVWKVPGIEKAVGAEIVQIGGRNYYNKIDRVLEDGTRIPFILVLRKRQDDPNTFYMMENKVSNELFDKYAKSHPGAVGPEWRKGWWRRKKPRGREDLGSENPLLPAFRMKVEEAHHCAVWIGGRLPSSKQWDKAAGLFEQLPNLQGPYLPEWEKEKTGICINTDSPVRVGSAPLDVSHFGIRDMAGNGQEYTRNIVADDEHEVPMDNPPAFTLVVVRGQDPEERVPTTYKRMREITADSRDYSDPYGGLSPHKPVAFRVVIEPDRFDVSAAE